MPKLDYRKLSRAGGWLDVRRRKLGMWAYALNRITGIGLVVYLYLHLIVLSLLLGGPAAWDSFVGVARSPYVLALDVILLAGILIHGLNGLRITLTSFSIGLGAQKAVFIVVLVVSAVALWVAALKIFST
jgi:succinate dehydrogenase / fumarate reductase cytochrome b subunit